MSKPRKNARGPEEAAGPYVALAIFCENALQEADGVLSAVRIVDTFTVSDPASLPAGVRPLLPLTALVGFRSGNAKGNRKLRLVGNAPSGHKSNGFEQPVTFEDEGSGVNFKVNLTLEVQGEGLYWFDVMLDDEFMTRMPLRIVYQHPADQPADQSAAEAATPPEARRAAP
jgi:hypothetical protein